MFIFSNLATSIDGKIATHSRIHFPLGTPEDRRMMGVLRKKCDAVIMGASTLRTFKSPLTVPGSRKQPVNVIVSSRLEGISPAWKFFTSRETRKIVFVGPEANPKDIQKFEKVAEVYLLKKSTPKTTTSMQIVKKLETLGIKKLLVEGGGGLMWDFIQPNLIDELYVTLTPRIVGGKDAPTLVDGFGFSPSQVLNLKLKKLNRVGDELYLVYGKTARRGP